MRPKAGVQFLHFFDGFFDFWGKFLGPEIGPKSWSRIRPSLGKLIARAPGKQFLGPVFGAQIWSSFWSNCSFFSVNFALFLGVVGFFVLQGPGLAARSCCCADPRNSWSLPCPGTLRANTLEIFTKLNFTWSRGFMLPRYLPPPGKIRRPAPDSASYVKEQGSSC